MSKRNQQQYADKLAGARKLLAAAVADFEAFAREIDPKVVHEGHVCGLEIIAVQVVTLREEIAGILEAHRSDLAA